MRRFILRERCIVYSAKFAFCLWLLFLPSAATAQQSLYAQSIQSALAPTTPNLEILVLELRTHQTLADTFAHPQTPIPIGSLVKPFLAVAYLKTHADSPTIVCHGHSDRCWKPVGHGSLTLTQAIAQSCNAYFLAIARDIQPTDIPYLPPPPPNASPTCRHLHPTPPLIPSLASTLRGASPPRPWLTPTQNSSPASHHRQSSLVCATLPAAEPPTASAPTPAVFWPKPVPPHVSIDPAKLPETASSSPPSLLTIQRCCSSFASEPLPGP